jgi:pimeloyl-ACP methyl ester carboxylesterase
VTVTDLVYQAMTELLPCEIRRGQLRHDGRMLRWIEAGSGPATVICEAALGEPGSLAYAGVIPAVAANTRIIAYDRAGLGASDPADPLSLDSQIGDLAALAAKASEGPCVLAGHSWGGLLVLLVAAQRPELIAGLVLVDPADELYWASLPPEIHQQNVDEGNDILLRQAHGTLDELIKDSFRDYANRLTPDQRLRDLILDAYATCYRHRSQAAMVLSESDLFTGSVAEIHRIRSAGSVPDVPLVVLSATTGTTKEFRDRWTGVQANLAASVPGGTHIVLPDTGHAINAERPEAIAAALNQVLAARVSG